MIRTRYFTGSIRRGGRPYHVLKVDIAGRHEVEITVSPTGRSWHLYVDGRKINTEGSGQ